MIKIPNQFICLVFLSLFSVICFAQKNLSDPFGWSKISVTAKPATFWWWLGSSVNEQEIERQLKMLKEAGFGGVTVCPIYEYDNPAIPPIEYLSDRWVGVFKFTLTKAKELGMLVDMTTGGGWPMGGPWIAKQNSERDWRLELLQVNVTTDHPFILTDEPGKDPVMCVTILTTPEDQTAPALVIEPEVVNEKNVWKITSAGKYTILVARMGFVNSKVYVAGNGGKGPVFDYWSPVAFKNLVVPLDELLKKLGTIRPRAVYCDSFEGQGGTTPGFFEAFQKINGYDVRPYMHEYLHESGSAQNIRLWHDYRATMAWLHVEFVKRWRMWANKNGMLTRYQYTGDPANPLNTCEVADIPEDAPPFNTSAAHIFGKKLISAEEYTWGVGHNFKDYLDYYRKKGDADFMQGLNHKIYHGTPFTPQSEPWPGPMYYAGGNFSENMPFFKHIRYLNDYFGRLQQTLQDSKPDMDVLMLWSIHDFWNMPNVGGFNWKQPFVWRNSNSAIYRNDVKENTRSWLVRKGIQTDLCSDEILLERTNAENGLITAGKSTYKILVIPETNMVGKGTLEKIEQLARDGATVIFIKQIPVSAPTGLPLVRDTSPLTRLPGAMAKSNGKATGGIYLVKDTTELLRLLNQSGLREEGVPGQLSTLRVKHDGQIMYFIRNNSENYLDLWIPLQKLVNSEQILVGNPRTSKFTLAVHRPGPDGAGLVHLVFEPTELLAVTTIEKHVTGYPGMDYQIKKGQKAIGKNWKIAWKDYQNTPHQFSSDTLKSWTDWPDLNLFSGMVTYENVFTLNEQEAKKQWVLDAGEVHESAEVIINGKKIGGIWTTPFKLDVSEYLKDGKNTIKLEVANKAQNRIIDMHRRGIPWQKSKLEEVNDERTASGPLRVDQLKPVISGLLGPVVLRSTN